MIPVLDRDRLLRDLRAAADEADVVGAHPDATVVVELFGMARGWRLVASAIEDGDYDLAPGGVHAGRWILTEAGWALVDQQEREP